MVRKQCFILIAISLIIFCLFKCYSFASNFKFIAKADKIEVDPGEEVTVELKLSEIDMGKNGINVVEGTLEYDKDFFSEFKFENVNDWEVTYNDEDGERKGKFLIVKMVNGIKNDEVINKIKIKVRSDISSGEGKLILKKIQSNDGGKIVDEGDRIITIKIKKTQDTNETKNEIKNEVKNEVKNEIKNEIKNEVKNEIENEIKEESTIKNVIQNNNINNDNPIIEIKSDENTKENAKTSDNVVFSIIGLFVMISVNLIILGINKKYK